MLFKNKTLQYVFLVGLPLVVHPTSSFAGAAEEIASPTFDLNNNQYRILNLPILYPANDNRTNMMLLLSDKGLASIKAFEVDKMSLWDTSSGLVPFYPTELTQASENKIPNKRAFYDANDHVYDERCITLKSGAEVFLQQVSNHKKISQNEKSGLLEQRNQIKDCQQTIPLIQVNAQWTQSAQQYASYLNGIILFYKANYFSATKIFTALSQVDDPWLKETAQYMLIRTSLNELYSQSLGTYGDLDTQKVDQALLKTFFNRITDYFKLYPKGQYVASARGFLRRGYWIANQQDALVKEMIWQMDHPRSDYYNLDMSTLAAEIDRKVFGLENFNAKTLNDPFFLAIYDLMYMRQSDSKQYRPISWSELNAQKPVFKEQPELFRYLQAVHLYFIQKKPQDALNYLPKQKPNSIQNYLELSQYTLKGVILEKRSDKNLVEQYWDHLLAISANPYQKALAEVALAIHYKNTNNQNAFLGNHSKIKQATLQKAFITQIADVKALESIITAKDSSADKMNLALYTLLDKSLMSQNYAVFNKAYTTWLPQDASEYKAYNSKIKAYKSEPHFEVFVWNGHEITPTLKCPKLSTLTAGLEKNPKNLTYRLCLGEYMRNQGTALENFYGDYYYGPSFSQPKNAFTGETFSRGEVYKEIIKSNSKSELQAYALYRAVMCYSPSSINVCGGKEATKSTRKQWYAQIKRDYPNTTWAKSLKYYW